MMFSLIGSLIGLVTSVGPGMFNKWMDQKQDAKDKAHELALMAQQSADKRDIAIIDQAGAANVAIQETVQTTLRQSAQWVVNYSGTVRPTITYSFFAGWLLLIILLAFDFITQDQFALVWSGETAGIFSVIISHWFGNKLVSKWTR